MRKNPEKSLAMLELLELGPDGPVVKVYGKGRLRVFVLSANFEPNVARITIVHAHANFWTSTKVKYMLGQRPIQDHNPVFWQFWG